MFNFIISKRKDQYVSIGVLFFYNTKKKQNKKKLLNNCLECPKWRHELRERGREREMLMIINNCEILKYYLG